MADARGDVNALEHFSLLAPGSTLPFAENKILCIVRNTLLS